MNTGIKEQIQHAADVSAIDKALKIGATFPAPEQTVRRWERVAAKRRSELKG